MNGEFPDCETDSVMDRLKKVAFDTLWRYGSEDCGGWINDLLACYPEEVADAFGNNPPEVFAALTDIWERTDYEDPRTGYSMTYQKWAALFAVEYGLEVYEELVKAKKELKNKVIN